MAIPDFFSALSKGIKRLSARVTSVTQTFNKSSTNQILTVPGYRDHLNDLLDLRQSSNSQDLLQTLFKQDTDVSAAVSAYLTLADTPLRMLVHDVEGQIDGAATTELHKIVTALTRPTDYSKGFVMKPNMARITQELRYMVMLRGAIGGELVFDKALVPSRLQQVDMASIEWFEPEAGVFKPRQKAKVTGEFIDLDIPTFFVAYHRRDPTTIYPQSDFVSAINTIAARTQVINDLYRIMRMTGFPRIDLKIMEEVVRNNMPSSVKDDPSAASTWLRDRLTEVSNSFSGIRADQPFAHYDSIEVDILNKDKPGASLQIAEVIETLNASNQAGLKTMATIIGRAKSGTNTASVEARIAAMNADQLNVPVKEFLDQMLTFLLNVYGIAGFVNCEFEPAELRPNLELEPQRVMKASRLREDLSLGLITDLEYHLQIHGRLPPAGVANLQGTGFMAAGQGAAVDVGSISPNSDALGRSVAAPGSASARSNGVTKKAA